MADKLISYIANKSEESAAYSLYRFLKANEPCFANCDERAYFEGDLANFTEFQKYFLYEHPRSIKVEGFGPKKINSLKTIFTRIKERTPVVAPNFFPEYYYSYALSRYSSLADRNFERIIFEMFNVKIFLKIFTSGTNYLESEVALLHSKVKEPDFAPNSSWFLHDFSIPDQNRISKIYDDMKVVRLRNEIMEVWKVANAKSIKAMKTEYFESAFEQTLKFADFVEFYGSNRHDRSCGYCQINETTIKKLSENNLINTKRFYSRGKTMEVDKRDPQKPYTADNLVLSCYWCNNAKTDEFTYDEYKAIGSQVSAIWQNRLMRKSG